MPEFGKAIQEAYEFEGAPFDLRKRRP